MPISPEERRRRERAGQLARRRQPRPAPTNQNPQPPVQQPQLPPRRVSKNRDIFWNIERIFQLLIMSGTYGLFICLLCYSGSAIFSSYLAQAVGSTIGTIATGYAQMILPATLLPYAGVIMLGLPLAITAYHFISAALTGTFNPAGKEDPSTGMQLLGLLAPLATFALGPWMGFSLYATYWTTGIIASAFTLLMSELPQELMMLKINIDQRRAGNPVPNQNPNPGNRHRDRPNPEPEQNEEPEPDVESDLPARNTRGRNRTDNLPPRRNPRNRDELPARQTRNHTNRTPVPSRTTRQGGDTLQQFGRTRREQPARHAADAAQARAQRQQQRGRIHTTTRRNPVAAPAEEGPRKSARLRKN